MTDVASLTREITVGAHTYNIERMSVFDQLQLAADFRNILIGLAIMKRDRPKKMADAEYDKGVQFIIASQGGVTPEIRDRVNVMCLSKVSRRIEGGGWGPVLTPGGEMMFADIEAPDLVKLLYAVFDHNKLLDFFSEGPSGSGAKK